MPDEYDDYYKLLTHRTGIILGPEVMNALSGIRVIIFGIGGVGSWCAESLVRTGIRHITIVDSDIISPTNSNRQIQAVYSNTGKSKVEELKKRLNDINPGAEIHAVHSSYDESTSGNFNLSSFDYVIDAIDSLKNKILLIENCIGSGVRFYSSMGAGAKTDPARIKVDSISRTRICPLARLVRSGLRKKKLPLDFICVYSDEDPVSTADFPENPEEKTSGTEKRALFEMETGKKAVDWSGRRKKPVGSLVHVTAVFGMMLSGLIINDVRNSITRGDSDALRS